MALTQHERNELARLREIHTNQTDARNGEPGTLSLIFTQDELSQLAAAMGKRASFLREIIRGAEGPAKGRIAADLQVAEQAMYRFGRAAYLLDLESRNVSEPLPYSEVD